MCGQTSFHSLHQFNFQPPHRCQLPLPMKHSLRFIPLPSLPCSHNNLQVLHSLEVQPSLLSLLLSRHSRPLTRLHHKHTPLLPCNLLAVNIQPLSWPPAPWSFLP